MAGSGSRRERSPSQSDVAGRKADPGLRGVVPFRFACHRCGHCCSGGRGYVWIEPDEIERMAHAFGASAESFARRFVREAVDPSIGERRLALREVDNAGGRCALLVGRNTCSVYDARPAHCRQFPYWDSVLNDVTAFESARSTCPGIAVEVESSVKQRAFAALAELHERIESSTGASTQVSACCLDSDQCEDRYVTALEIDYALDAAPLRNDGCRLGDRRPLTCRAASAMNSDDAGDGEANMRELRAIERTCRYPAAYGPLAHMLRSRQEAQR